MTLGTARKSTANTTVLHPAVLGVRTVVERGAERLHGIGVGDLQLASGVVAAHHQVNPRGGGKPI